MSIWLTYGLLGVVAGPAVIVLGRSVAWREPLSWYRTARTEWPAMWASGQLLSAVLVYVARRQPDAAGVVSWLVIVGCLLSFIDWTCNRLPHVLVAALLAGGIVHCGLLVAAQADGMGRLLRAVAAALLVFMIALTKWLASPEEWGGGDVTLSATVAFFLGWFSWLHVLVGPFLAFALGVLTFAVLRVRNGSVRGLVIPFGPALVFGSIGVIGLL